MHKAEALFFVCAWLLGLALPLPRPAAAASPADPLVNVPGCTATGGQVTPGIVAETTRAKPTPAAEQALDVVAEAYVKLALAVGQHDPDYVDAYYGPPEWKQQAERTKMPLAELTATAQALSKQLQAVESARLQGLLRLRHNFLAARLRSVEGRISLLAGRKLPFDEESKLLYDVVLPEFPAGHFEAIRARLDKLLPGEGPLADRLERFENRFVVPKDKVEAVMRATIAECRRRTRAHIGLPENETFKLELVTGRSWGAYNWYKGGAQSVIQINVDLPFRMVQAFGLSAHEGYPGHHVQGVLLEQKLVRERGWIEFQIYPLFSPETVVSEGAADFGIELVFPLEERVKFAREVLFPLAGLDSADAARYFEVLHLAEFELPATGRHILRRWLDGRLGRKESLRLLSAEALVPRARAEKWLEFAQHYRAYLATYGAGYRLVKNYVEARSGSVAQDARRWEVLRDLLSAPMTPADLR